MYYAVTYPSPIGRLTLACGGNYLAGLWIEGQKYYRSTVPEAAAGNKEMPVFEAVREWLDRYFAGEKPEISELQLAPDGSEFRREVWKILCEIPYGEVTTYGEIASKMAVKRNRKSMSGQAVGGAIAHNPISIIIPCHRVVGSDGSMTGYAAGVHTKARLLEWEGANLSRFL